MGAIPATFDIDYTRGIQKTLSQKLVLDLIIDGNFGPTSCAALSRYQLENGIRQTGVYDAATQAKIEPFLLANFVTRPDFQKAADDLGVPIAAVKAVQETETSGSGFTQTGKVRILFERHWMARFLSAKLPVAQYSKIAQANPDIINTTPGGYATGPTPNARSLFEYGRFSRAFAIDPDCAMKSASWGLFQIMGFNANFAGFKNADGTPNTGAFVDAMKSNEQGQLQGFVNFIKSYNGGALWQAMKISDWVTFARIYNGSGAVAEYSQKLGMNFTTFMKQYA